MRFVDGQIVLSPSDLMKFQGCAHASALDLRKARGEPLAPAAESHDAVVLQRRGDEHEKAHLAKLWAAREVVAIDQTVVR